MPNCPFCGQMTLIPEAPVPEIREEIRIRREFVQARLRSNASRAELKDLTDFMHGFAAPLLACSKCGLLVRDEAQVREAHSYEEDPNDIDLMRQLLPRYVTAFRNKEPGYKQLIRPRADVLELGSHLGAFLQVGQEWNWQTSALDVGIDTAEFARRNGFGVRRELIEESSLRACSFDAVFIWNCFEQIQNPASTLEGIYRVLRPNGLLVVRVPNATFYRTLREQAGCQESTCFAALMLAYNNLLGFPYLYGYTSESLNKLLLKNGFQHIRGFNTELVTLPFADLNTNLINEQRAASQAVAAWTGQTTAAQGTLTGPWIEIVYRKLSPDDWRTALDAHRGDAVIEMPRKRIDRRFLRRAA